MDLGITLSDFNQLELLTYTVCDYYVFSVAVHMILPWVINMNCSMFTLFFTGAGDNGSLQTRIEKGYALLPLEGMSGMSLLMLQFEISFLLFSNNRLLHTCRPNYSTDFLSWLTDNRFKDFSAMLLYLFCCWRTWL